MQNVCQEWWQVLLMPVLHAGHSKQATQQPQLQNKRQRTDAGRPCSMPAATAPTAAAHHRQHEACSSGQDTVPANPIDRASGSALANAAQDVVQSHMSASTLLTGLQGQQHSAESDQEDDSGDVAETDTTDFELRQVVDLEGQVQCFDMDAHNLVVMVPQQLPLDALQLRTVSQLHKLHCTVSINASQECSSRLTCYTSGTAVLPAAAVWSCLNAVLAILSA